VRSLLDSYAAAARATSFSEVIEPAAISEEEDRAVAFGSTVSPASAASPVLGLCRHHSTTRKGLHSACSHRTGEAFLNTT